ncbi:MAG: flagellar biosynthesis protein FlhF [Rubrivivax sp.]
MNLKRFSARTSREALALVRQAFGDDAVVMSTRPCAEGVEVLAMAPESVTQLERVAAAAERVGAPERPAAGAAAAAAPPPAVPAGPAAVRAPTRGARIEPTLDAGVGEDVRQMQMSTLSFQDYVRERMLKRRAVAQAARAEEPAPSIPSAPPAAPIEKARTRLAAREAAADAPARRDPPVLREEMPLAAAALARAAQEPAEVLQEASAAGARADAEMLSELRSMRGLIEQRFGALAFMEKLQRQPRQALLTHKLLDIGLSPALTRKLAESLPNDVAELDWAAGVLERNLATGEREGALEDLGGVHALIGATGVGKTTSTAKLAAAFAARHGAANLGLVTLDAYRIGAHEQLRTYGRILGVPVHTAHDRASLEDLLELLAGKRMVLIDTAGMAQRDHRTRELLEMLSHPSIKRLLVVNAAAQGETIEDQLAAYGAGGCRGVVLSKVDEAVKLGPALDALIRARLKVLAVANGQRVPEDWHRLSAAALVQHALKARGGPAWRLEGDDVSLIFAGAPAAPSTPNAPNAPRAPLAAAAQAV